MDTLQQMIALNEACEILRSARGKCATGSMPVWQKLRNASDYLDARVAVLLAEA
jgi:hypothetical protein